MIFHTYGNKENKAVVLIHGMLTPWQIWNTTIEKFSNDYYVVVPELDAHTEEMPTVFNSVEEEAEQIREYIVKELNGQVFLLAGLSMGGRIAATLAKNEDLNIENMVLDGAPLDKANGLMRAVTKASYKSIITKSKKHDAKIMEQAKKDFLPEEMLPYYIKIAENNRFGILGIFHSKVQERYEDPLHARNQRQRGLCTQVSAEDEGIKSPD